MQNSPRLLMRLRKKSALAMLPAAQKQARTSATEAKPTSLKPRYFKPYTSISPCGFVTVVRS